MTRLAIIGSLGPKDGGRVISLVLSPLRREQVSGFVCHLPKGELKIAHPFKGGTAEEKRSVPKGRLDQFDEFDRPFETYAAANLDPAVNCRAILRSLSGREFPGHSARTAPLKRRVVAQPSPAASSGGVLPPGSTPSGTLGQLAGGTPALRGGSWAWDASAQNEPTPETGWRLQALSRFGSLIRCALNMASERPIQSAIRNQPLANA
jgi:hypothetical protein